MIEYPSDNFDTFVSIGEADAYFETRLHSASWLSADSDIQDQAIITGFNSICELDIVLDPDDAAQVKALKAAQCEQALYELKNNIENQFQYLMTAGVMMAKKEMPRYSERAIALLRPYLKAPSVSRIR